METPARSGELRPEREASIPQQEYIARPGAQGPRPATRSLSGWLGLFSVGLGVAELVAPAAVARLIGLRPTRTTSTVLRVMGGREIATGLGILANRTSKEWVGMRVGGDVVDLALLGAALVHSERPARTVAAALAVTGVAALDVAGTERLAEERKVRIGPAAGEGLSPVVRSITVERPLAEVYAFWADFANFPRFMANVESVEVLDERRSRWRAAGPVGTTVEWESEIVAQEPNARIAWRTVDGSHLYHTGEVRFRAAGEGATVVTVALAYRPPGGRVTAAALKLFRREPGQQVGDDLRRFKQVLEIGEVLLSDASVERKPRPAAPKRHAAPLH